MKIQMRAQEIKKIFPFTKTFAHSISYPTLLYKDHHIFNCRKGSLLQTNGLLQTNITIFSEF